MSSVTALPVVDLRDDPGQLRWKLRETAHEVGFFYLTGHGVREPLIRRLLDAAHWLFALPQADKDAIAMVHSRHFRGYTRLGGELTRCQVDWREQIDIGPERAPVGVPGKPDYWWLQGIYSVYGRNAWKSRLRAHPDVARRARILLKHIAEQATPCG